MKNLLLAITSVALLSACASADKMLERGDYDGLVELATKKLSGKKKKDTYVLALEEGFEKITRRDMARIESLKNSTDATDWEAIMRIAKDIERRQDKIEPFLPLVSETGYKANFTFVKTDKIVAEAKRTAIQLYEDELDDLVASARNGNKNSARDAYDLIGHLNNLGHRAGMQDLRDEMRTIGVNKILVSIQNHSSVMMPAYVEEELLSADFGNFERSWDKFYTEVDEDMEMDYHVILKIQDIFTSNDEWREIRHPYSRQIKDGWEYVLDANGNVAKDSLGNDIKRDRFVQINATVVEMIQTKRAFVRARVDIMDLHENTRIFSQPLEFEDEFSHVARNFFGDERAIDHHLRQRILPVAYPSDAVMIREAIHGLKPVFFKEIRRVQYPT